MGVFPQVERQPLSPSPALESKKGFVIQIIPFFFPAPITKRATQVKFINSGTVKATDNYVWGITTSGRDPSTTAANAKAGTVLYLEKYNISSTAWGAGGAFPYLWKDSSDRSAAVSAGTGTCTVGAITPHMDMRGSDIAVAPSASPAACGATCCGHSGCGGFVWINRTEDPDACSGTAGCCFLKQLHLPVVSPSAYVYSHHCRQMLLFASSDASVKIVCFN